MISAVFFRERVAGPCCPMPRTRKSVAGIRFQHPPRLPRQEADAGASRSKAADEYAATGMGRRTDHAVTQVWMDLEDAPAQTVNIRYEFRPQLVRLGILSPTPDPLDRRERARGFEDGFSPVPPHLR